MIAPPFTPTAPSSDRIEIKIDGPLVSAREFLAKAAAAIELVNAVAVELRGGKSRPPRWIIRDLRMGSAVMVAERDADDRSWDADTVTRAVSTARSGLLTLAQPDSPRPAYFSRPALKAAKQLASRPKTPRAGTLVLHMGGARVEPSEFISVRVSQIARARFQSVGSIEGKLVDLSSRDGYSIAIIDARTQREIRCVFPESMKARVRKLFDENVRARGTIWSREDGERVELELKHIDPMMGDGEELPTFDELRGILRGAAGATK